METGLDYVAGTPRGSRGSVFYQRIDLQRSCSTAAGVVPDGGGVLDMNGSFSYRQCRLCPRDCGVNRANGETGVCGTDSRMRIGRAAPYFYEEPCLSGTRGSGAVFFVGCSLRCGYCQNVKISQVSSSSTGGDDSFQIGKEVSCAELADIFLQLQAEGVHNINLVTASHFTPGVVRALEKAKTGGLVLPVVWNSSGYETLETLRRLEGLVDIYLPDCKYVSSELSGRYSGAPDYFEVCSRALSEMVRQTGEPLFFSPANTESESEASGFMLKSRPMVASAYNEIVMQGEDYAGPLMSRGTIVRHLALPGGGEDSRKVLRYLHETFANHIYISLMAQYTVMSRAAECVGMKQTGLELHRRLHEKEYDALAEYCLELGVENAFLQSMETADESFIPSWNS